MYSKTDEKRVNDAIEGQLKKQGNDSLTADQIKANAELDRELMAEEPKTLLDAQGNPILPTEKKEYTEEEQAAMEASWQAMNKKIGMADFIDDQIRRGLGIFIKNWNDSHPNDQVGFKLHLRKERTSGGVIGSVSLVLEMKRGNEFTEVRKKTIKFNHIREMRDGHAWKMALYEAMFWDLVTLGASHLILIDETRKAPTPGKTV